eukprot:scaffold397_cov403-Prasinococcus_capsulatus_cf.AAC.10
MVRAIRCCMCTYLMQLLTLLWSADNEHFYLAKLVHAIQPPRGRACSSCFSPEAVAEGGHLYRQLIFTVYLVHCHASERYFGGALSNRSRTLVTQSFSRQ